MAHVNSVRDAQAHRAAHAASLPLKVQENDPGLTISLKGDTATIKGVGSNRGTVPSFASFTIQGKQYDVDVSRGMTASQVMDALKAKLPSNLTLVEDSRRKLPAGAVAFTVTKATPAPRLPIAVLENDPGLNITVKGRTAIVSGVGSNRGIAPSFASFTIQGSRYDVDVRRGMTPAQVVSALEAQLPASLKLVETHRAVPDGALGFFTTEKK